MNVFPVLLIPDAEEPSGALWGGDGKLNLAALHGDLSIECALMVHAGVHLNRGFNKLRDMDSHPCHKFNSKGWLEQ